MKKPHKDLTDEIMQRAYEPRPDSDYDELISTGVRCSTCNNHLSINEILMHKYVDIINPADMLCQAD